MNAPSYTKAELRQLTLPGFGTQKARLRQALVENSAVQPVLSLTLLRSAQNGSLDILTSIRRGDSGRNRNHENIVSTHTLRIPLSFAYKLAAEAGILDASFQIPSVDPLGPKVIAHVPAKLQSVPDHTSPVPSLVETLLSTKLGCGDMLERSSTEQPALSVSQALWLAGYSYVGDKAQQQLFMPLIMIGVVGYVLKDFEIEPITPAYWGNSWVPLDTFEAGVKIKDTSQLITGVDEIEKVDLCVRGLCVDTSLRIVSDHRRLEQYLPVPASVNWPTSEISSSV